MEGARSKKLLKDILGLGAVRAAELWEGVANEGRLGQIRSLEQLRTLPEEQARILHGDVQT